MRCRLITILFLACFLPQLTHAETESSDGNVTWRDWVRNQQIVDGLAGYNSYEPVLIDGACIMAQEWFSPEKEPNGPAKVYGTSSCPIDPRTNVCPSLTNCTALGKKARFNSLLFFSEPAEVKRNRGIDNFELRINFSVIAGVMPIYTKFPDTKVKSLTLTILGKKY